MEEASSLTTPSPAGLTFVPKPVEIGQVFVNRQAARLAVERELAAVGRVMRNGKGAGSRQLHVVCKTCPTWFVRGCAQKTGTFKITQAGKEHTNCDGGGGRPSAKCLEPFVQQLVHGDPSIKGTSLKRSLKKSGMDASARTSQRMKKSIVNASKEEEADAIARLPSLCEAIEQNCPGSVATVEEADGRFVRSFLMLGKSAHVAANSVPKIVSMDAGHLKGAWKGVMYILSMKDSNNRIIHVSTVIADKENETNYRFLLEQTCKNAHLGRLLASGKVTFFIDGHRGSPPALRRVLPSAPVRTCLRHLVTNKGMKAMGAELSSTVYKAAKMPSVQLFEEAMAPIRLRFPTNYALLMKTPLEKWTHHATDRSLAVLDTTTSNNAESTIAMVGAEARALDPFHLTMSIAERSAEHLATNAELKKDSSATLVPFADKFIENERILSLKKSVKDHGLGVFLVQEHGSSMNGNRVKIQLPDGDGLDGSVDCTCSVPSRWKLPCCHALAALRHIHKLDLTKDFVDRGYTLASYRDIHSNPDFPVELPYLD